MLRQKSNLFISNVSGLTNRVKAASKEVVKELLNLRIEEGDVRGKVGGYQYHIRCVLKHVEPKEAIKKYHLRGL